MKQSAKILKKLEDANGQWVSGRIFLHEMYLSQYHARIWELQKRGYKIEASSFVCKYGFRSYRMVAPRSSQNAPAIVLKTDKDKPYQDQMFSLSRPY